MIMYKCGYCGQENEGDIWCSEDHRLLWYESKRVPKLKGLLTQTRQRGPNKRVTGGKRRGQQARAKKT